MQQVRLPKWKLEETAERLSKPKERIKASKARAKAVQLKYEYDKTLRGGRGGYRETFVAAKTASPEEKQEYMVTLAERCKCVQALRSPTSQPQQPRGGEGSFSCLSPRTIGEKSDRQSAQASPS